MAQENISVDVVIIGAGPAGLTAARRLANKRNTVLVLEARDRIGGRMHTSFDFTSIPVEIGAELVHGDTKNNNMWPFLKANKIGTFELTDEWVRLDPQSPFALTDDAEFYNRFPKGRPPKPESFQPLNRDETVEEYLTRLGIEKDNRPVALHLSTFDTEGFDKKWAFEIEAMMPGLWSEDDDEEEEEEDESEGFYRDFRVPGGYIKVLQALAKGLDIKLSSIVNKIETIGSEVKVTATSATDASRQVIVTASHCIVTVPAPVLSAGKIEFSPPLSDAKKAALLDGQNYPVAKLLMEFSEPVLPNNAHYCDDLTLNPPCFWNAAGGTKGYKGQVVVGWSTGDNARELLALPEKERFEKALKSLEILTGRKNLPLVQTLTHDWTRDPFSMGAYGLWRNHAEVFKPEGKVFFAGMVLDQVNFAYDSGIKAANLVLKQRKLTPKL